MRGAGALLAVREQKSAPLFTPDTRAQTMRCLLVALLCFACLVAGVQLDIHVKVPKSLQLTVEATAKQLPHNQVSSGSALGVLTSHLMSHCAD